MRNLRLAVWHELRLQGRALREGIGGLLLAALFVAALLLLGSHPW